MGPSRSSTVPPRGVSGGAARLGAAEPPHSAEGPALPPHRARLQDLEA